MSELKKFYLYLLGLPKTIIFNFRYLDFLQAVRMPILISHRVWLMKLSGSVKLNNIKTGMIKTGMIKIGFGEIGIFDQHNSRTIWQVSGEVEFKGAADIGHGSKISVSGNLTMGKGFRISAESSIVSKRKVSIGDNVLISWDCLVMDSDLHDIYDNNSNLINSPQPIVIGSNVWLGCRTLILKGVSIADGVVVAAGSTVTKSIRSPNSIVGERGGVATIIKENIIWKH